MAGQADPPSELNGSLVRRGIDFIVVHDEARRRILNGEYVTKREINRIPVIRQDFGMDGRK